jgi:hypothetical protein
MRPEEDFMVWIIFLLGAGRRSLENSVLQDKSGSVSKKNLFVRTRLPIVPSFRPGKDWFLPQ